MTTLTHSHKNTFHAGIIEYLNKWAYVYVGLYGYSYLEAGRNVITLFENKGWTAIVRIVDECTPRARASWIRVSDVVPYSIARIRVCCVDYG